MQIDLEELSIISAGAGSGKTYTVQETLSSWLKQHPDRIRPDRILAVTFTNMAASEMQSRIRAALLSSGNVEAASKVASAQISTIHSFGQSIIKSFAYETGMSPNVRQLSEAEEEILLQLTLSSHEQINAVLQTLEKLGYKGKFDGSEYSTGLEQLQSRVLDIINKLRTIGATASKARHYIELLTEEVKALYGPTEDAASLNDALHSAVKAMLASYPQNMKEAYGGNGTADREFTANYKDLKKAFDKANIETDWELWQRLQSLRLTKIKDDDYKRLAEDVMAAAKKLSQHPGPLEEALMHIETLLEISIDTLESYNEAKRRNALIDFSDMVHLANSVMNRKERLKEMAAAFDCLVIDEFQDTNPIQFTLLWRFKRMGLPTLIVGDLKQSIMGFQGADASLFESLLNQQNATTYALENNWRSTPALMEWINALGKGVYKERYTPLTSQANYPSTVTPMEIIEFGGDHWSTNGRKDGTKSSFTQRQYGAISEHIKKIIGTKTIFDRHAKTTRLAQASDIAILAPNHKMLSRAADALREHGLEAQIKQGGWLNSRIVQIAFYALSYLVNPSDKHAALYLLVTELGAMSLQEALDMFLRDETFAHPILEKLDALREETQTLTVSLQLIKMIEALELWEYVLRHEESTQQRANLLKLIDLCSGFEALQFESLNALGIYGRNLNSFLSWLSMNEDDAQPSPKSINTEAVQLMTWHASKGLEWPIVVVMGLDMNKAPSLPDISIGYADESRDEPLSNTFIRFFTKFQDASTNEAFLEELNKDAHKTVENLLYVAMTRAREQLILPWPSFKEEKAGEFSFMHKLMHQCNMVVTHDGIDMDGLARDHGFAALVIPAVLPEETDETQTAAPIHYGRTAIEKMEKTEQIPSVVSPSNVEQADSVPDYTELTVTAYGNEIGLSEIKMGAADLGTLIHHCYHVLLVKPALAERLFASLDKKLTRKVFEQIREQVSAFERHSRHKLGAQSIQCEVPVLSKTEQGSVVSGSIDLFLETEEGYWIIDHKSDTVGNFDEQFTHHYPQLEAYARFTKLDKPLLGVGINWTRYGKITLLRGLPLRKRRSFLETPNCRSDIKR